MSENLLRIELYRILVSIAVGLITILVFIFNVNVAERYNHSLNIHVQSTQTNNEERKGSNQNINDTKNTNQDNRDNPTLKWEDLKSALNRTLKFFNENIIAFLVVSIFVGEFISWIGMIFILGLYERRLDKGLYNRELYVDEDIGWKLSTTLLRPMVDEKPKFALGISEVHFALAKAFSGISLSMYICSSVLLAPTANSFIIKELYVFFFIVMLLVAVYILLPILILADVFINSLSKLLFLVKHIEKLILTFSALFTFIIFISFLGFTEVYPIEILSLVEIFTAFLSFLLSIYHMRFANQFMCLASEECYKKQDTIQETTSQPSTNQSPPQSPPKHTQER